MTLTRVVGTLTDRGNGQATWTLENTDKRTLVVHLEPEGDEIRVRPRAKLVVAVVGGKKPRSGSRALDVAREQDVITIWSQWPGSRVVVKLNGRAI